MFYTGQLVTELLSRVSGNIGYHDTGRAGGDEIGRHGFQSLPDFRILGKVGGHIVFHRYPSHGNQ